MGEPRIRDEDGEIHLATSRAISSAVLDALIELERIVETGQADLDADVRLAEQLLLRVKQALDTKPD